MARKRKRPRHVMTPLHWWLIGLGGTVALGGGGYGIYRVVSKRRRRALLSQLPPPTRQITLPIEPEGAAAVSPCGSDYPGFVFDGDGCVPGEATPGGIYVGEGCTDFVFVEGDAGPQLDHLESIVAQQAEATSQPVATSADPTALAADFFATFWGDCSWPPSPSAPQRIVQLYQAIVFTIGHEIVADGGRVLGTNDPELVDEQIAERLQQLGFFDFAPEVVSEIEIPDALPDPAVVDITKAEIFVKP